MSAHGEKKTPWDRYFIFASAIVMGMCTGAFFYVTVFAPEYANDLGSAEHIDPDAVVIQAAMYGGCERLNKCASFQLTDDQKYQYAVEPEAQIEKGKISKEISNALFEKLTTGTLISLSEEIPSGNCSSYADGLDYYYDITKEGTTYTLDTCTSAFSRDKALQKEFLAVWSFMENPTTTYPTLIEEGITPAIFERFNNPPTKSE